MNKEFLIEELKERVIRQISPRSIILFGSTVEGLDTPDSDIDILIVWDEEPFLSNRERRMKLRQIIGDFDSPLDLLTYTSAELESALAEPRSFTSQIVKKGKLIYGRLH